MIDVPSGGQVDFQVEAMIGYVYRSYDPNATDPFGMFPWVFAGETSGWSSTQTVTIPVSSTPSPSPTPSIEPTQSPEPQQPEPSPTTLVITTSVIMAVIVISLFVYFRKHKPLSKEKKQNTA
jgi:hypothetical protein